MTFPIYPSNGTPKQRRFSYRLLLPLLLLVSVAAWYGLSNIYYLRHLQSNGYAREFSRAPELGTLSQTLGSTKNVGDDPLAAWETPDISEGVAGGEQGHDEDEDVSVADEDEEEKYEGPLKSETIEPPSAYGAKLLPLTDITFTGCVMPAFINNLVSDKLFYSICGPAEEEYLPFTPSPGPWHRVKNNINVRIGWGDVWMWYKRLQHGDDESQIIKDIKVLPHGESPEGDGWIKHRGTLRAYMPPQLANKPELHLWILRGDNSEKEEGVTEVDITYGSPPTQWGWESASESVTEYSRKILGGNGATIVWKKGNPVRPDPPPLKFSKDGTFSILQISDLHFSTDPGHCYDLGKTQINGHEILESCKDIGGDKTTTTWLERVLLSWLDEGRRANTDYRDGGGLVVLAGDQLNGQKTSWDAKSALLKAMDMFIRRRIAWTVIFGDRDDEDHAMSREEQMAFLSQFPYFVGHAGPEDVAGVGNYRLSVSPPDSSSTELLNLYFLDSHGFDKNWKSSHHDDRLKKRDGFEHHEVEKRPFDWLKQNQIDWYRRESGSVQNILRPWTPSALADGDSTFGLWDGDDTNRIKMRRDSKDRKSRNRRAPKPAPTMKKPNALMFFHIPIQEAYADPDRDSWSGEELLIGEKWEDEGAPKFNSGMFHNGILTQREDKSPTSLPEVKGLSFGHTHATSMCRRVSKVWLCFGSGSSFSGYGREGFERGVREFGIEAWGEKIWTGRRILSEARQGTTTEKFWLTGQEDDRWIWRRT